PCFFPTTVEIHSGFNRDWLPTRVRLFINRLYLLERIVSIDLSRGEVRVTQKLFYCLQRSSVIQHVRSKGMTQNMWTLLTQIRCFRKIKIYLFINKFWVEFFS